MAGARMHHAWMLSGLKGLGKGLFARAAAAELVTEPGVPQPPAELHPDILIPEHPPENKEEAKKREDGAEYRRKRSIPIEEIRTLIHRLHTRPTLGSRRAVIIDPADDHAHQIIVAGMGHDLARQLARQRRRPVGRLPLPSRQQRFDKKLPRQRRGHGIAGYTDDGNDE